MTIHLAGLNADFLSFFSKDLAVFCCCAKKVYICLLYSLSTLCKYVMFASRDSVVCEPFLRSALSISALISNSAGLARCVTLVPELVGLKTR